MGLILFGEKPQSDCLFTRARMPLEQMSNVSRVNTPAWSTAPRGLHFIRRVSVWLLVNDVPEPQAGDRSASLGLLSGEQGHIETPK